MTKPGCNHTIGHSVYDEVVTIPQMESDTLYMTRSGYSHTKGGHPVYDKFGWNHTTGGQ